MQPGNKPTAHWPTRLILIAALLFAQGVATADDKTDILYMKNGDRVTGEITQLLLGEVYLETRSFGNIKVKWKDIRRIESDKYIQFETTDGSRYFGSVEKPEADSEVIVNTSEGQEVVEFDSIIYFEQINRDQNFWDRLDKHLRLGFSYTQASDVMRWNVATGLEWRETDFNTNISFESFVTNNREGEDSRRANLGASYTRYLRNRYLWVATADLQTNDELGVDQRFLLAGGFGRYIVQSQQTELTASLGLAANWESSVGDDQDPSSSDAHLEGILEVDWTFFKLSSPKARYRVKGRYFPGLSDTGRNRADINIVFKQEFVADLFWNLELFGSYDSRPPSGAQSTSDYGIITSLEYEW